MVFRISKSRLIIRHYCYTRLHLGFSAKLKIWQVSTCKLEPRSGIIFCKNRPGPTSQSSLLQSMVFYVSLSPPIMSVPTYHVCPHLSCLSPPIMSVPTYYVCPHLPIMSVPTYFVCPTYYVCPTFYVCPHLLCLLYF